MNETQWTNYQREKYKEIPPAVLELACLIFEAYALDGKASLRQTYDDAHGNPYWFIDAFGHHGGGTSVRNLLRTHKLTDDLVPDGNLDDYYTVMLEHWIGVRP